MEPYEQGYAVGVYKRENPEADCRWDFVDASKTLNKTEFDDFRRGFNDGVMWGRRRPSTTEATS